MSIVGDSDADEFSVFLEALDSSKDLNEMETVLSKSINELGFKYVTYHVIRVNGIVGNRLPYIVSNYPRSWIAHYFSMGYLDDDPVVGEALRRLGPFCWREIAVHEPVTRRQSLMLDEARDAGVQNGLTIPLIGQGGANVAALSVVPDGSGETAASALRQHRHLLHLIAIHFHKKASAPLLEKSLTGDSPRRRSLLSHREREVLEWIARGKSTWEISSILDISEKGVEFHAENAKRKLHVFNRTHAVVKAIMLGIIVPG
jgi:DNA-binding CsgD family transcriptional regulator